MGFQFAIGFTIVSNETEVNLSENKANETNVSQFLMRNTSVQVMYCWIPSLLTLGIIFIARKFLTGKRETQKVCLVSSINNLYDKLKHGLKIIVSYSLKSCTYIIYGTSEIRCED